MLVCDEGTIALHDFDGTSVELTFTANHANAKVWINYDEDNLVNTMTTTFLVELGINHHLSFSL